MSFAALPLGRPVPRSPLLLRVECCRLPRALRRPPLPPPLLCLGPFLVTPLPSRIPQL